MKKGMVLQDISYQGKVHPLPINSVTLPCARLGFLPKLKKIPFENDIWRNENIVEEKSQL
jgi:hypothetical protein